MSRSLRIQYPYAYYHVTCRGNERKEIFRDREDRQEFFRLLARSLELFEVHCLSYALMPNHFHLLLCTPKGNLSNFMRHFNISYTGYFNRKYKRAGHLYQGRYKAFLIDADHYLLEVSRYIHLNPMRMKSKKSLEKRWRDVFINDSTSLPGYMYSKHQKTIIHYATILDYFGKEHEKARAGYKAFMLEGTAKDISNPLEKGKGAGIIGRETFINKIRRRYCGDDQRKDIHREQPQLRKLDKIITPEDLVDRYSQLVRLGREELTKKGKQSTERAMLMELLYRLCNITQPEIGKLLGGIDYSAVSQARKRLYVKMQNDPQSAERFKQMQEKIKQMSRIKI
ncbi:MAG: transposase [Syntrophaceae bacterium]|nr:transposase [Syntrophaceae bacterium]